MYRKTRWKKSFRACDGHLRGYEDMKLGMRDKRENMVL